jgi:hypothetical protein
MRRGVDLFVQKMCNRASRCSLLDQEMSGRSRNRRYDQLAGVAARKAMSLDEDDPWWEDMRERCDL